MKTLDDAMEREIEQRLKGWPTSGEDNPEGTAALRKASAEASRKYSTLIAEGMAKKACEGNVRCAEFLDDRAREHKELIEARTRKPKRSLATEWAHEPEWTDEDDAAAKAEQRKSV